MAPAETRGLVAYSGTLGLQVEPPRAKMITAPLPPGASLVLWTDGLSTRVDLAPGDGRCSTTTRRSSPRPCTATTAACATTPRWSSSGRRTRTNAELSTQDKP